MKAGKILTVGEARAIAEAGGRVWLDLNSHDPHDQSYHGPVSFEAVSAGGYLLNGDEPAPIPEEEAMLDAALGIFQEIDPSIQGISFPITDLDFSIFDDDDVVLDEDFGAGTMQVRELVNG